MQRRDLPPSLTSAPFSVAEALDAGISARRLRASDLVIARHGVRSAQGPPASIVDACRDYAPLLREGHLFSHMTAAELWGLPLPPRFAWPFATLHVTAITGASREPRRSGVTGHRGDHVSRRQHFGMPVVSPLRAWVQCAEYLTVDELVVMGDALVSKWSPYIGARYLTIDELAAVVERMRGHRGYRSLKEALSFIRYRVWSPKESETRLLIVHDGLAEPDELNRKVFDDRGRLLGRPDMTYRSLRTTIEYEGDHHRRSRATFRTDITRRERFADAGWRMIRVTDDDLSTRDELVARFRRYLPQSCSESPVRVAKSGLR